ncbi:MAG: ABC-2 family transporter protein [Verrucomicrobia bacterium]|nr:ABC-2 family transporter protein [Verrucomicrobiota bacterium]
MNGYAAILKIRMKTLLQYRAAALAGITTQLFWGLIQVMILRAFYLGSSAAEPISLSQTITFIWIGQALLQLLPWNIDKEIEAQVRSGNVAYELLRPLHLYGLWYARSFAMRSIPTLLRCLPIFLLGGWFFGLMAPISWQAGVLFGFSTLLALLLSSAMTTLVIVSLFWTISGEGIQRLLPHITVLFSGMIVPLPLFPTWMQPFLNVQPFRAVMDIPCRLYTGVIPSSEGLYYLLFQLAWILFFMIIGQWLLKKAVRQFVIQGG